MSDNGWKYVEASNASSPFTFTTNYALLQSPVVATNIIQYFVMAQDMAGTPNVSSNTCIFATAPTSVTLAPANFPLTGTVNSYTIQNPGLSGTVMVGAAETYKTLTEVGATGVFADINSKGLSGNLTVTLMDATYTETAAVALTQVNNVGCAAGPYTLTIKPNTGVTTVLSGTFAGPLIDLNGADNVTFDGSNNGTSTMDMTIRNTSTTGNTFRFINDATSNLIKNIKVEGVNTSTTSGTILFSTTTGILGNSNNTINNCFIRDRSDAAGVPANAVYSSGTAAAPNASNTVSGCQIFNWTNSGVLVSSTGAGNGWTVNPSSFYQTANRTTALVAISIQGGSGHSILNNNIGGSASDRSGAPMATTSTFSGISLTVGFFNPTSVQGNKISNLNISGGSTQTSQGINVINGSVNIGTISGNTIGGAAAVFDTCRFNYDTRCIYNQGGGTVNIENNVIGNIAYYNNSGDEMRGIRVIGGVNSIRNNIVRDLKSNATSGGTFFLSGIDVLVSTAGNLVEGNEIYNLNQVNTTGGCFNIGIFTSTMLSGEIRKNKVYNLNGTMPSLLYGIYKLSGFATYSNNMVALSPTTVDHLVVGLRDDGTTGTNSWLFNSVSIGGSTGGVNSSYAFFRTGIASVVIRNNILSNTRTGGTGFHVAIGNVVNSASGWPSNASNYNDLFAATPGNLAQWLGLAAGNNRTLAGWQASQGAGIPGSGGDANSFSESPTFTSSTDLHIPFATSTQLESGGNAFGGITTDIDGHTRPGPAGSVNGGATAPDVGADEFDGVPAALMSYVSSTTTQGNTTNINTNSTTQEIIGIQVVTTGVLSPLSATSFSFSTNGTTATADIANAKLWYTGTSPAFATSLQVGATVPLPSGAFMITPSTILASGTNYFWLTYDVPCGSMAGNVVDAECNSLTVGSPQVPTLQAPPGSRTIVPGPISGTKTVGTGGGFNYLTLTDAVAAINSGGLGSNTILEIQTNLTEPAAVTINPWGECPVGPYTLTIRPAPSTNPVVTTSSTTAVINFNGADNVIIDGSNNGSSSKNLTIRNTGTGPAIRLVDDARLNMIKNTIVESQNTSTTSGTIFFTTSVGTLGNSNNTINNCDIRDRSDAAGVPANGVYSLGSAGAPNATNTVSGCQVFNWTNAGVLVAATGAGNNWTINPTSFYQTADRTTALTVISILGGSGHSILSNSIGGSAADRSGNPLKTTSTFTAISLAVGTGSTTNVQGNTISNLNISGGAAQTFKGINVTAGNVNIGTTSGNTLGGAAAVYDTIRTNYDSDLIENSGIGIVTINNNTIGNVSYYNGGGDRLFGIRGTAGTISIAKNIVRDLKSNGSSTAFSFFPGGIWLATTVAGAIVDSNKVYNITHSNGGTSAYTMAGIYVSGVSSTGTPTILRKNQIYNLNALGTGTGTSSPRIWGIHVVGSTTSATYANNMISLGSGVGNESRINGIEDLSTGTNNFYFNSVSITGTTGSGSNNSYAFNRSSTATVDIKDNIFSNARTGGTGFHVAIANTNAAATGWAASASDYNDLYNATSTNLAQWLGSTVGFNRDLVGWRAAQGAGTPGSGGDANAISVAPLFTSTTDLHLTPANGSLDNLGIPWGGILTDIDGEVRSVTTPGPDMGADEFAALTCTGAVGGTAAGSTTFCGSGTPMITATLYSTGIGSGYQWQSSTDFAFTSPNDIGGQTNPSTLTVGSVSSTTYYRLKVTCPSGMATDYSNVVTITVIPLPSASVTPTGPITICAPNTQLLTASTSASSPSYQWKRNGGNVGTNSNSYAAGASGNYTVVITDGVTTCSNTSNVVVITVNPQPQSPPIVPMSVSLCPTDPAELLTVNTPSSGSVTVSSGALGIAIPDFPTPGISNGLVVGGIPSGVTIDSAVITLNISHTWVEDLDITLLGPNGNTEELSTDNGGQGDNYVNTRITSDPAFPTSITAGVAPFTGTYKAEGILSNLFSVPNGTWTLNVSDDEAAITGILNNWSIKIYYSALAVDITWSITPAVYTGLFIDPGATMPYTGGISNTVYALPATTTTYTATATSAAGCTNTNTVLVTVNTLQVENIGNGGGGSLREVIRCALPGSTITFPMGLTGLTIPLGTEININKNLTVIGLGKDNLTISGGNATRIFHIDPTYTFEIDSISMINANAVTNGGAVYTEGNLILENVRLQNCTEGAIPVPKAWTASATPPATVTIKGNVEIKN